MPRTNSSTVTRRRRTTRTPEKSPFWSTAKTVQTSLVSIFFSLVCFYSPSAVTRVICSQHTHSTPRAVYLFQTFLPSCYTHRYTHTIRFCFRPKAAIKINGKKAINRDQYYSLAKRHTRWSPRGRWARCRRPTMEGKLYIYIYMYIKPVH